MIDFVQIINNMASQLYNYTGTKTVYERQRIPHKLINDESRIGIKINNIIPEHNKKNNITKTLVISGNPNYQNDIEYTISNNTKVNFEIVAYSKSEIECIDIINKAYNWFNVNELAQYDYDDNNTENIEINNLSDILEKSNIIETNYQYRYYFDFDMQIIDEIKILESTIENVNVNLNLN